MSTATLEPLRRFGERTASLVPPAPASLGHVWDTSMVERRVRTARIASARSLPAGAAEAEAALGGKAGPAIAAPDFDTAGTILDRLTAIHGAVKDLKKDVGELGAKIDGDRSLTMLLKARDMRTSADIEQSQAIAALAAAGRTFQRFDFRGTRLQASRPIGFVGAGADVTWSTLQNAEWSNADLRGARFDGAKLRNTDIQGARLPPALEAAAGTCADPVPALPSVEFEDVCRGLRSEGVSCQSCGR